jgi:hypothetical protein
MIEVRKLVRNQRRAHQDTTHEGSISGTSPINQNVTAIASGMDWTIVLANSVFTLPKLRKNMLAMGCRPQPGEPGYYVRFNALYIMEHLFLGPKSPQEIIVVTHPEPMADPAVYSYK